MSSSTRDTSPRDLCIMTLIGEAGRRAASRRAGRQSIGLVTGHESAYVRAERGSSPDLQGGLTKKLSPPNRHYAIYVA